MNDSLLNTWQDVRKEVLERIHSRQWKPGELIPNEVELAEEFGCARATVNRALRAVAESGLLERKRKAGTRVAIAPVSAATLRIPIIRHEIENKNQSYSYQLINARTVPPPESVRSNMNFAKNRKALCLNALHLADNKPYALEERWINTRIVPDILLIDLTVENANEWLVKNAPFTKGDITFSATQANATLAKTLNTQKNNALFVIDRTTWDGEIAITSVRMTFHAGYQLRTAL